MLYPQWLQRVGSWSMSFGLHSRMLRIVLVEEVRVLARSSLKEPMVMRMLPVVEMYRP